MPGKTRAHRLYHYIMKLSYATPRNMSFVYRGLATETYSVEEQELKRQLESLLTCFELDVRENEKNPEVEEYETIPILLSDETKALQNTCLTKVKEVYNIRY
ncbi:hypothetical protein CN918_30105 [Priestia megaterium]|nr:hypothetical protein CN918_30105 [Priestia megaterium]